MALIKTWEELTICDNFLFQKVMQNESLCKRLIEKLLNIKIQSLTYSELEKSIDPAVDRKGIRLDLFVVTDDGTMINIEMQTTDSNNAELVNRTRYYQSLVDLDSMKTGAKYKDMKKSYIIFICTFDHFNLGRKVYTFTNRCHECEGLELGDGTCKIFLNAKGSVGEVDKDIDSFLAYVSGSAAQGEFTQDVASEVERIKRHDGLRREYMSLRLALEDKLDEGIAIGEERGIVKGKAEERLSSIRNLIENLGWTAQKAMEALRIPAEEQPKYLEQINGPAAVPQPE